MKRKNRIQKKNINIIKEPPFINFFIFRREKNRGKTELFELEKSLNIANEPCTGNTYIGFIGNLKRQRN